MTRYPLILLIILAVGCAPTAHYTWQDTRTPAREDATFDLKICREYAAAQYKPGIPAGAPYLREQKTPLDPLNEPQSGEWRPDRDPTKSTSIQSQPVHDVPVEYTGYPGELDYYPDYLDDILEKCMKDKGWEYLPSPEDKSTNL